MSKTKLFSAIALGASLAALALPASADHRSQPYQPARGGPGGYGGGAVLHADAGFSGQAVQINGAEADLSRIGFNDKASSITIGGGAWQVCTDANFRGRCEIIDASTSRLNTYRLNDNISSLRPLGQRNAGYDDSWRGNGGWKGRGRAGLVLYPDAGMRGNGIEVDSDIADLGQYRFNDKASSFQVTGGTWLVCEHADYRGRCEVLKAGAGDLKPIRMNDNISSIRRYDSRRY